MKMKFTDARADVVCTAEISAFAAKVNVCKLGAELSLATLHRISKKRKKNTGPNTSFSVFGITDPFFSFFFFCLHMTVSLQISFHSIQRLPHDISMLYVCSNVKTRVGRR